MHEGSSQAERRPVAAFVLALLAGLWMLLPGAMQYVWRPSVQGTWRWGGWMWHHGMMRHVTSALWWPWFGMIAGIVILIGAAMLYAQPRHSHGWGMVILILSALNVFLGMGGLLASVFGIIGGALALSWKP